MTDTIDVLPLPDTSFGGLILADEAETFVAAAEAAPTSGRSAAGRGHRAADPSGSASVSPAQRC